MIGDVLSLVIGGVLSVLGVLHVMWALGSHFPCANEQILARTVIGRRGITKMPSTGSCLFVATCLFAAAAIALMTGYAAENSLTKWFLAPAAMFVAVVFLTRGVIGVLPAFERALPEQPFLYLNRRLYSPISFLLGIGFLLLVLSLPNWFWRLGLYN